MNTPLDDAGRIELPLIVQTRLGVRPGDEVALDEENGRWFIRPGKQIAERRTDDDLHWEELEYDPVPLRHVKMVTVQLQSEGKLSPLAHELEDE